MCAGGPDCPLETSTQLDAYRIRHHDEVIRKRRMINQSWPKQPQLKKARRKLRSLQHQKAPDAAIDAAEDIFEALQDERREFMHPILASWIARRIAESDEDYGPDINPYEVVAKAAERRKRDEELRAAGQLKTAAEWNETAEQRLRAEGVIDPDETLDDFRANSYFYRQRAAQRKIDADTERARAESNIRAAQRRALLQRVSDWMASAHPVVRDMYHSDFTSEEQEWVHFHFDDTPPDLLTALVYDARGKTRADLQAARKAAAA